MLLLPTGKEERRSFADGREGLGDDAMACQEVEDDAGCQQRWGQEDGGGVGEEPVV